MTVLQLESAGEETLVAVSEGGGRAGGRGSVLHRSLVTQEAHRFAIF